MGEILSAEAVAEVQQFAVAAHPPQWGGNPPIVRLCRSVPDLAASHEALRARLAEVEQALREAKEALDKTVRVLLTVKPNLDRPYPDAPTLTPWTRWCEPLARRVDDARRSARAVLDKGEPDGR